MFSPPLVAVFYILILYSDCANTCNSIGPFRGFCLSLFFEGLEHADDLFVSGSGLVGLHVRAAVGQATEMAGTSRKGVVQAEVYPVLLVPKKGGPASSPHECRGLRRSRFDGSG